MQSLQLFGAFTIGALVTLAGTRSTAQDDKPAEPQLGAFSVSLAVEDLEASRAFYENLGFRSRGGMPDAGWLILTNGSTKIGLFQGLFERNMLTFNPGWTQEAKPIVEFTDVRAIQARLEAAGIEIDLPAVAGDGPAHFVITDPDGNPIMFDQHVPKPKAAATR